MSIEKLDQTFALTKLKDSLVLCKAACPCCGRPCDADHT